MTQYQKAGEAAAALQERLGMQPEIGIILGSGLGGSPARSRKDGKSLMASCRILPVRLRPAIKDNL